MKAKSFKVVNDGLKHRISAKSEKLRCYRARRNQYGQKNFSDATKKHCIKSYVEKKDQRKFHLIQKKQKNFGVNYETIQFHVKRMLNG